MLSSSTDTQDGTQDPIEYISSPCSADREGARIVIVKKPGSADRSPRLNTGGKLEIATSGQTYGHWAAQDVVGVAAVDVADAGGAGGVFNGTESVERFSSDGPRRMFSEANGTPITPGNFSSTGGRVLQKPDLAAADGVSTSTPGFSTFYGTSAAAPHAAGIAALMLEASCGPSQVTPSELRAVNPLYEGREAVEVVPLDPAYGSNFRAEDLEGGEVSLEWTPFGGTPRNLRLRFGAGLRFEESELDGEGEVVVRTTTAVPDGRAGLAYPGVADPKRLLQRGALPFRLRLLASGPHFSPAGAIMAADFRLQCVLATEERVSIMGWRSVVYNSYIVQS